MLSVPSSNSLRFINTQLSWLSSCLYKCSSPSLPFFLHLIHRLFSLGPFFPKVQTSPSFVFSSSIPNIPQGTPLQNTQSHINFSPLKLNPLILLLALIQIHSISQVKTTQSFWRPTMSQAFAQPFSTASSLITSHMQPVLILDGS